MIGYNDIYELLRKEKYSESLQQLPKNFVSEFSDYLADMKGQDFKEGDLFAESSMKAKKQLENAIALFKELMLRRKKKLLNLVFVATETGIMKRDYENMMDFEKKVFDNLIKSFEEGDKDVAGMLNGKKKGEKSKQRLIMFNQQVEEFVGMSGEAVGPFAAGELVNLESGVAEILVSGGKASFVDEN